jgi:hypothetical protein
MHDTQGVSPHTYTIVSPHFPSRHCEQSLLKTCFWQTRKNKKTQSPRFHIRKNNDNKQNFIGINVTLSARFVHRRHLLFTFHWCKNFAIFRCNSRYLRCKTLFKIVTNLHLKIHSKSCNPTQITHEKTFKNKRAVQRTRPSQNCFRLSSKHIKPCDIWRLCPQMQPHHGDSHCTVTQSDHCPFFTQHEFRHVNAHTSVGFGRSKLSPLTDENHAVFQLQPRWLPNDNASEN